MKTTRIYCDIDGVLADIGHRMHYLDEKNYDGFYGCEMADDEPIEGGITFLDMLVKGICTTQLGWDSSDLDLVFVTGRPERSRTLTGMWLTEHLKTEHPIKYRILMRKDGDYRKSPEVKAELIRNDMNAEYATVYFIDDDPSNCEKVEPVIRGWLCEAIILCFGTDRYDDIKSKP
jgi:hypothetical protein